MTQPVKAVVQYNGEVLPLSPESAALLAAKMKELSGQELTVTVTGVWHVGVLYADSQMVVLDREAYDGLLEALLKATGTVVGVQND